MFEFTLYYYMLKGDKMQAVFFDNTNFDSRLIRKALHSLSSNTERIVLVSAS